MADETRIETEMTRREFLRSCGRGALAGGIIAAASLLWRRRSSEGLPGHKCVNDGICRGCPRLSGCPLPTAVSLREKTDG